MKKRSLHDQILLGITEAEVVAILIGGCMCDSADLTVPLIIIGQAVIWLALFTYINPHWDDMIINDGYYEEYGHGYDDGWEDGYEDGYEDCSYASTNRDPDHPDKVYEFVKEVTVIEFENGQKIYADIGGDANHTAIYDIMAVLMGQKKRSSVIVRIVFPKNETLPARLTSRRR